jgi:hypothetical protein
MIIPCKTVSDIMDFVEVGIMNVEAVVTRIVNVGYLFYAMSRQ